MRRQTLNVGTIGDDVARLHEQLKKQGLEIPPGELQRQFFGPGTRAAVMELQSAHGLSESGEVDAQTASKVGLIEIPPAAAKMPPQESPSTVVPARPVRPVLPSASAANGTSGGAVEPAPPSSPGTRETIKPINYPLRQNDQGEEVVNLQQCLFLFIEKQVIQGSEEERRLLEEGLKGEERKQIYNDFTAKLVGRFQEQFSTRFHLAMNGEVDAPTADALNKVLRGLGAVNGSAPSSQQSVVRGQVVSASSPLSGIEVNAFDRDIGEVRQRLGDPDKRYITDSEGHFEIGYTPEQFAAGDAATNGKLIPDLVFTLNKDGQPLKSLQIFRVPDGKDLTAETLLSEDDLILGIEARDVEEVRIVVDGEGVPRGPSEYERLMQALQPVLLQKSPADLDEQKFRDVTFVARETGLEREKIEFLVIAFKLSRDQFANDVRAEVFYGLARTKGLTDLRSLASTSVANLYGGLVQAGGLQDQSRDNIISPFESEAQLNQTVELIRKLAIERLLTTPSVEGRPTIAQLLSITNLSVDQQASVLSLYFDHEGPMEDFWKTLREQPGFTDSGVVENLQLTLQLGALTQNNLPLIQELQRMDHVTSTRDLVKLDAAAWTALVSKQTVGVQPDAPGATPQEKTANYVNGIVGTLQTAFPTQMVAQIVANAPKINLNEPVRQAVSQFFANSPEFNLRTAHIDSYVAQNAATAFSGIPDSDRSEITNQVKRLQRILQVSTGQEVMTALLGSGLDSAHAIASIPRATFVEQHKESLGGEQPALQVYDRATHIFATTLHAYTQLYQAKSDVLPPAIGASADIQDVIKTLPSYNELFGSLDLCDCEDCRSVYSPAAYLVDLLEFLKNGQPNQSGLTPLDVLIGQQVAGGVVIERPDANARRPDLKYIKLTCENTNTEIPYVDLVNEVLESYIVYHQSLPYIGYAGGPILHGVRLMPYSPRPNDSSENVTAEELGANPENTSEKAYEVLRQAVYPGALPYNQPLEVARVYLDHLGSSRYEVMETFRKNSGGPMSALASEYLKISAEEFETLTGMNFGGGSPSLNKVVREFYGYDADTIVRTNPADNSSLSRPWQAWLTDVPEFLRRTSLSYLELIELLKMRFLNPRNELLAFWERNHISYADLANYANTNFTAPNEQIVEMWGETGMGEAELVRLVKTSLKELPQEIVLYPPDAQCDLSKMKLQRLDGSGLDDAALNNMQRFIRLWRKVGGTMRDLDRTMTALQPGAIDMNFLLNMASIVRLRTDLRLPVAQLLSFWANIDTEGDDSLYGKLFLSKAALKLDSQFELNVEKSELEAAGPALTIKEHVPAILAAFRISEADLTVLRAARNMTDDPSATPPVFAPLHLANLSELYRHVVLAKALKLTIKDLVAVKVLVDTDPFSASVNGPQQTADFVKMARKVRSSGFFIAQLNYLYRHLSEPSTNLAPQRAPLLSLASTLREGLTKIAEDTVALSDPTGELTRARLGMIFESSIVDQTIQMIDGSAIYSAPLINLPVGIAFAQPLKRKIVYDETAKMLRFTGTMTAEEQTALVHLSGSPDYLAAIADLFQQPRNFIKDTLTGFLDLTEASERLLDIASLDESGKPVLLDKAGKDGKPVSGGLGPKPVITAIANKFAYFLEKFLPYLRDRLSHSLVKQTIGEALQLDGPMSDLLLEKLTSSQTMADCLMLGTAGLSGEYFSDLQLTTSLVTRTDASVAFDGQGTTPETAIPANTGSIRWRGMLVGPDTGDLTLSVHASGNVQLWLGDILQPLQSDASTKELISKPLPLKAGQMYDLRLEVTSIAQPSPNTIAQLRWQSATTPKAILPSDKLYPGALLDNFANAFTLLHKIALLVHGFKLTDKELAHFSDHAVDFDNFDLLALPLRRDPSSAVQVDQKAVALFRQWQRQNDFVTLRNSLPQGDVTLIDVFRAASLEDAKQKLKQASGWDDATVEALVGADGFNLAAKDFKNEIWLIRLQACVRLTKRLGVSVGKVFEWAAQPSDAAQAQAMKNTVKAKYDDEAWLTVAKPLTDKLRESQKAALIAYLLPLMKLESSNQLFEYFLIDVDMSACMATSRIKQAICSVQLFVQRCLMNLEQLSDKPELSVSPSAIDAHQWQWMKHYRIWEANRKVFLYPENWMEPELRDDKSPFFKELESELLQNELTNDLAETALINYLDKLDQVARLEICGMYWQDQDPDTGENTDILHVFGRTFHTPQIYYYRRLVNNATWTPWEKVELDIEGNHLIPVVWNRRLYLFWALFAEKPSEASVDGQPSQTNWEITLAWSEYTHSRWSRKHVGASWVLSPRISGDTSSTVVKESDRDHYNELVTTTKYNYLPQPFSHFFVCSGSTHALDVTVFRRYEYTVHTVVQQHSVEYNTLTNRSDNYYSIISDTLEQRDQYDALGRFAFPSCHSEDSADPDYHSIAYNSLIRPEQSENQFMRFEVPQAWLGLPGPGSLSIAVLRRLPTPCSVLFSHQFPQFSIQAPFFCSDKQRTYFVRPDLTNATLDLASNTLFSFNEYYHPYSCEFLKALNKSGIAGLLSVASQELGNPYLHSPWRWGSTQTVSSNATGQGSFIQSDYQGNVGNFEAVVLEGKNLVHYWRDNSDGSTSWKRGLTITSTASGPGSLIQGTAGPGKNGNLDVVVLEENSLVHYWRNDADPNLPWMPKQGMPKHYITPHVPNVSIRNYSASIIRRRSGGKWILIVLTVEDGEIVAYVQDNGPQSDASTADHQWVRNLILRVDSGRAIITSPVTGEIGISPSPNYSKYGPEEVVVLEGNALVHYNGAFFYSGSALLNVPWERKQVITTSASGAGSILQSNLSDRVSTYRDRYELEVVVPEGNNLVHYWQDDPDANAPWHRGQVITSTATGAGCIIQSTAGRIGNFWGNFEVLALQQDGLAHYWNGNNERFLFEAEYDPNLLVVSDPLPTDRVDFNPGGAYSLYNWELFFHTPLMIAIRLSKDQRFEEAMQWFHYIFNPTDDTKDELSPARYWKVVPLKTTPQQTIAEMFVALNAAKDDPNNELNKLVANWRENPFLPYSLARLRPIAYKKNVVMKYIDNLVAWGDQLFRQDTIEAINEATQLYVLAANMLGERPQRIPRQGVVDPKTYAALRPDLDKFSNAMVILENEFPVSSELPSRNGTGESNSLAGLGKTLYFCIPQNDKLLGYWDTVADRLFKIRHCTNFEGIVRQLPLFEPPIDPALLVQAAAQGVDLGSVLNDLNAPTPYYRFSYVLQKALELCAEIRSLGGALLSALEKMDAEELSAIRASHETTILNLVTEVKKKQIDEANAAKTGLEKSREVACTRYVYYQSLLTGLSAACPPNSPVSVGNSTTLTLSDNEKDQLQGLDLANSRQEDAAWIETAAHISNALPNFNFDTPFSVPKGYSLGGAQIAAILQAVSRSYQYLSTSYSYKANRSAIMGGHSRRADEWAFQRDLAAKELEQIDKQIAAADIRTAIASQELINHDKQIENAQAIEEFLRNKYTNRELYTWMKDEVFTVYSQCYHMAYDLAKRAEKCFRFERGVTDSNFVQFGYWDSARQGLLSGERLYLALKQMERAYLEQNKREYEITKHISLVLIDPLALIALKETGQCEVLLPEALFDADYPGHYMRRLKSVSLTIPCVVGPYTSINCTLTLLSNKTRINSVVGETYDESADGEDDRFVTNFAAMQSIATSHAQNDNGMFELNFRDERYLPFEGAGVESRWRIDLPKDSNAFDFETLSDVILHLKYTAREGGEILKRRAKTAIQDAMDTDGVPFARLFSAKHEFPTEWYRFLHPADLTATSQTLQLGLTPERFPFQFRGQQITITKATLFLKLKEFFKADGLLPLNISFGQSDLGNVAIAPEALGGGKQLAFDISGSPIEKLAFCPLTNISVDIPKALVLSATVSDLATFVKQDAIEDIWTVCEYSAA